MQPPTFPPRPPAPAGSLDECPRCGEHWPPASPYCNNCGWVPGEPIELGAHRHAGPRVADEGEVSVWTEAVLPAAHPTPSRLSAPWLLGGVGVAALLGLALWWVWSHASTPPSPLSPPSPQVAVQAVVPVTAPNAEPASAAASPASDSDTAFVTPSPASAPAATLPASAAVITNSERDIEAFVRDWLAVESRFGAAPDGIDRLQSFYAPAVAYHGQPGMGWSSVAAEKAGFARRWPLREYELLQAERLVESGDQTERIAARFRWRLETQGRWRSGVSTVLLTLDRADGRLRIVGEQPR